MASGDTSFRSSKGKMSGIESLPDDIVFNILVRIPAEYIYKATRLVCKKWYKMINTHNFSLAHDLQHSTSGLVACSRGSGAIQSTFVEFPNGQVEVSSIDITSKVISSCNGLILESHGDSQDLCIMNPATKQHFALPRFLDGESLGKAMAYDATSKVYKVVHMFYKRYRILLECAIFTVGVDIDWTRRVDIENIPLKAKQNLFLGNQLATYGFVHWCKCGGIRKWREPEHVLTLNVETEVITQFPVPVCDDVSRYYYLPIGRNLCLMIGRSRFLWEVWEMNSESGEWTMVMTIDLEAQKPEFELVCPRCRPKPVGWLKFREVLVFSVCRYTIAYNCCTGSIISSFQLNSYVCNIHVHRNSLVRVG